MDPQETSRRSDRTKAAILAAARERFAADGYERATIRAIAADAAIDPSMVMRYYGSKDKLFAAAAEFDLRLSDLAPIDRDTAGRSLVAHFLHRWEDDEALMILMRAATNNEAAAERTRAILTDQLAPMVATLGGDPAQAPARAGLVASQMLGLALCRYVLRFSPILELDRDEIVDWLGPTIQRYLIGQQ